MCLAVAPALTCSSSRRGCGAGSAPRPTRASIASPTSTAGDRIDLTGHKAATDFADLRATASQFGTDTHLRLGVDTIVLEEVALAELSANMFLF